MIYDIPLTTVERFEQRISRFIREWLGLNRTISPLALYSKHSPCPLPLTSLTSLFKTTKASSLLQLRASKDPLISASVPELDTGKKWKVSEAVQDADSVLHFRKILGHTQTGKAGLSLMPNQQIPDKGSKEYRKALSDTVAQTHDQQVLATEEGKKLQNSWTEWTNFVRNDLTWKCIWAYGPNLVQFCVQSSFNTLPSPNNLLRWGKDGDGSCALCSEKLCTLPHILSSCSFSLKNGRFTFRHDSVLKVFLESVEDQISKKTKQSSSLTTSKVKFIRPGEECKSRSSKSVGLLDRAKDWTVLADIGLSQLVFPVEIFATSIRPDVVLYSISKKIVILVENTCGCEEKHSDNHLRKVDKYSDLVEAIRNVGWACHFFGVEVGARGFNSTHVPYCLKSLGFPPKSVRETLKKLSRASLETSYQIWLARKDADWKPPEIEWKSRFPVCPLSSVHTTTVPVCSPSSSSSGSEQVPKPGTSDSIDFRIDPVVSSNDKLPNRQSETVVVPNVPEPSSLPASTSQFRKPSTGLENMGNTCYANAILTCLFSFPELWDFPSSSPLLQSLKVILVAMNSTPTSFAPKSFLVSLRKHITGLQSHAFRYNQQHDTSEVLVYILQEVHQFAPQNPQLVSSVLVPWYYCQSCNTREQGQDKKRPESVLNLQVSESVSASVQQLLAGSELKRYCQKCQSDQICTEERIFDLLPNVLILRLLRDQFDVNSGVGVKLDTDVHCDKVLTIGSSSVQSPVPSVYHLASVIHHTGDSLDKGHYFTTLINTKTMKMWGYNDVAVDRVTKIDGKTAYLLFYRKAL